MTNQWENKTYLANSTANTVCSGIFCRILISIYNHLTRRVFLLISYQIHARSILVLEVLCCWNCVSGRNRVLALQQPAQEVRGQYNEGGIYEFDRIFRSATWSSENGTWKGFSGFPVEEFQSNSNWEKSTLTHQIYGAVSLGEKLLLKPGRALAAQTSSARCRWCRSRWCRWRRHSGWPFAAWASLTGCRWCHAAGKGKWSQLH